MLGHPGFHHVLVDHAVAQPQALFGRQRRTGVHPGGDGAEAIGQSSALYCLAECLGSHGFEEIGAALHQQERTQRVSPEVEGCRQGRLVHPCTAVQRQDLISLALLLDAHQAGRQGRLLNLGQDAADHAVARDAHPVSLSNPRPSRHPQRWGKLPTRTLEAGDGRIPDGAPAGGPDETALHRGARAEAGTVQLRRWRRACIDGRAAVLRQIGRQIGSLRAKTSAAALLVALCCSSLGCIGVQTNDARSFGSFPPRHLVSGAPKQSGEPGEKRERYDLSVVVYAQPQGAAAASSLRGGTVGVVRNAYGHWLERTRRARLHDDARYHAQILVSDRGGGAFSVFAGFLTVFSLYAIPSWTSHDYRTTIRIVDAEGQVLGKKTYEHRLSVVQHLLMAFGMPFAGIQSGYDRMWNAVLRDAAVWSVETLAAREPG